MERSDQELISAIKRGDQDSARMLYERYYDRVARIAWRYLRSWEDALDIAQEVFLRILGEKKILAFRGEAQFSSWIYKITANLSLSFLTRHRKKMESRQMNIADCQITHAQLCEYPGQLHNLEVLEKAKHLGKALSALPGLYGKCLYLRYFEGHKYKEIAKQLRITQDRVGMQLLRSRLMLTKNPVLKEMYAA